MAGIMQFSTEIRAAILAAKACRFDQEEGGLSICRPLACPFNEGPPPGCCCVFCEMVVPGDKRTVAEIEAAWRRGH